MNTGIKIGMVVMMIFSLYVPSLVEAEELAWERALAYDPRPEAALVQNGGKGDEWYRAIADCGAGIMRLRQEGIPLKAALERLDEMDEKASKIKDHKEAAAKKAINQSFRELTLLAYEWPRFATRKFQDEACRDFWELIYLRCVKRRR